MIGYFKNKPDIILYSESWIKDNMTFIRLTGYAHYSINSRINKSGGMIIYVNDN